IAPAATLSQMTIPAIKVEIPEMRLLQAMPIQSMPKFDLPAMPKFEFPAMPKMDLLTLPQFKDLQRLELLQPLPCIL
ncbi:MAG TPA: hypothetical protein VJT09_14835, partial [Pyrinomonadaceae bacterium]|nr:hypothetical protein [Pyrinomonadaceae bacterium]